MAHSLQPMDFESLVLNGVSTILRLVRDTPQSNGKVESSVKTAKRLMFKAKSSRTDPWLALLAFRNTPTQGYSTRPAQWLMRRRTRTTLPTHVSLLEPEFSVKIEEAERTREKQKASFDSCAKDLPVLKEGDTVRVKPWGGQSVWAKARVMCALVRRLYKVQQLVAKCWDGIDGSWERHTKG